MYKYNMKEILLSYINTPVLLLAGLFSTIATFFNNYLFLDWNHLATLIFALCIDFIFAVIASYKLKNFQLSKVGVFGFKVAAYFCIMFLLYSATYHETNDNIKFIGTQLNNSLFYVFLLHEIFSIIKHARILGVLFPAKIDEVLDNFNKKKEVK